MITPVMHPHCQTAHKSKRVLGCILLTLIFFLIAAEAYESDSVFERIKQSLPQREAGWKIIEADEPYMQIDGSQHANFLWGKGEEEVSASVVLYKSLKDAESQFKRSREGETSMDSFLIDGIGDEAYLFPPIILNQEGPFNLRFRKGRYEIWMSAKSRNTVHRCAQYIADSISEPDKGIQPDEVSRPRQ